MFNTEITAGLTRKKTFQKS